MRYLKGQTWWFEARERDLLAMMNHDLNAPRYKQDAGSDIEKSRLSKSINISKR
jgi:hypothetical protein